MCLRVCMRVCACIRMCACACTYIYNIKRNVCVVCVCVGVSVCDASFVCLRVIMCVYV